jgi:hypothetical protein
MNTYLYGALALFVVLYASLSRPHLPGWVVMPMENTYARLALTAAVVYVLYRDVQTGILLALALFLTLMWLNEQHIAEGFLAGIEDGKLKGDWKEEDFQQGSWQGGDDQEQVESADIHTVGCM